MNSLNFIYSYLKGTRTITGYFPILNTENLSNCTVEAIVEDESLIPSDDVLENVLFYFLLEESTDFDEYYLTVDVDGEEFDLVI